MAAFLHHLSTRNPAHHYRQEDIQRQMQSWVTDVRSRRLIQAIYQRSGIDRRHSVCAEFGNPAADLYRSDSHGRLLAPSTGQRNAVFARESVPLSIDLARDVMDAAAKDGIQTKDVTHLVFASCTGFVNPGVDYQIIRALELSPTVQRYTLGFMGCYAAFPALRMATQFCEANPEAVVLVMCLELCTLHLQIDERPDSVLAHSLFADGAAAGLVSAREPKVAPGGYRLDEFASTLVPGSETDMAWDIGDSGFNLVLSSYVPDILGANLQGILDQVMRERGWQQDHIAEWAVHPGGRAILDRVSSTLGLKDDALVSSRRVLRDFGNMSSPTVLFVLKDMLDQASTSEALNCALAFGPGLTVEMALLKRIGGTVFDAAT